MEAPNSNVGYVLDALGAAADLLEAGNYVFEWLPSSPDNLASLDIILEFGATITNGTTYFGRPHDSAPEMLVVGQDVWFALAEKYIVEGVQFSSLVVGAEAGPMGLVVAHKGGEAFDFATSMASFSYDIGRMQGSIDEVIAFAIYFDTSTGTQIPISGLPVGQPGLACIIYSQE